MNLIELVKRIFNEPNMEDWEADGILWGCTGFPCFWKGSPSRALVRQLNHARRAFKRGYTADQIYVGDDTENPNHIPAMIAIHNLRNTKEE